LPIPERKKSKLGKIKIKGGFFSAKQLKKKFERAGEGQVIYLKPDEDVRIRFLTEPDQWFSYAQHSLNMGGKWITVPCIGDGCPADDEEGVRTSEQTLVPVWDVEKKKVRFIKAGSRLGQDLLKFHSKDRLLGRDFTLMREGDKMETRYLLDAEEKSKRPEAKDAEIPDMEKILASWVEKAYSGGELKKKKSDDDDTDFDDDDEDEEDAKKKSKKKGKAEDEEDEDEEEEEETPKKKSKKDDDDEDEDEDEDEEEDEKPKKKPKGLKKKDKDEDEEDDDDDDDEDEDEKPKKKKKSSDDDDEEDDD
jgi:hypothetical protein